MPGLRTGFPTEVMPNVWAAVANTTTTVATKTCMVYSLIFKNPSGGALTITVSDNDSVPLVIVNAASIAAGGTLDLTSVDGEGQLYKGGLKMLPSAAGLVYVINARQSVS